MNKYEIHDLVVYNDEGVITPAFVTYVNINILSDKTVIIYTLSTGEALNESLLLRVVDKDYINNLLNTEKFVEVEYERI